MPENSPAKTAEDFLRDVDAEPKPAELADVIVPMELAIPVDYRLGDGTRLTGSFIHRVPTPDDERRIALVAAGLRGGHSRAVLGDYEATAIDAMAYLTVTLVHRPPWAAEKGLGATLDPALLFAVAGEATAHRDRFRLASRDLRPRPSAA